MATHEHRATLASALPYHRSFGIEAAVIYSVRDRCASMFATVLITMPDLSTAERIARALIEKRLAACANYFPVRSMYIWEGELERAEEYVMLLKVRSSDFSDVVEEVKRLHPYDVPCIVKYEISEGFAPYLDWVNENTERLPGQ